MSGKSKGVDIDKLRARRAAAQGPPSSEEPNSNSNDVQVVILNTSKECQQGLINELSEIKDLLAQSEEDYERYHDTYKSTRAALTEQHINDEAKLAEWKVKELVEADPKIRGLRFDAALAKAAIAKYRLEWEIVIQKINFVSRMHQRELAAMTLTGGK